MNNLSIEKMIKSGMHLGHKTQKCNPKMKKYIIDKINGISIIDLKKSLILLKKSIKKIKNIINNNGKILFVGTKKCAKESIKNIAINCNQYFINNR